MLWLSKGEARTPMSEDAKLIDEYAARTQGGGRSGSAFRTLTHGCMLVVMDCSGAVATEVFQKATTMARSKSQIVSTLRSI